MLKLKYRILGNLQAFYSIGFLCVFYVVQDVYQWPIIRLINAQGPFVYVDTFTVLHFAECFEKIGNQVFSSNSSCPNWTYSSTILRALNLTGFTVDHTKTIGHMFTYLALITLIIHLINIRVHKVPQIMMILGFISPSIWLLFQRANFDILIYLMVFIAAYLYSVKYELLSLLFLFMASLFKFYTLPILLLLGILSKKFTTKIASMITFVLGLFIVLNDFVKMDGTIMQAGNNHFGMKIIGNYLGKIGLQLNTFSAYLVGFLLLLMSVLFLIALDLRYKLVKWQEMIVPSLIHNFVIFMSGVHLVCYILGLSVDYRLVFYITSAPYLMMILTQRARSVFIIIFLISVWFVYPVGIFQTIGDLALQIITAFQLIFILRTLMIGTNYFNKYTTVPKHEKF
jgi:hypothetical protein